MMSKHNGLHIFCLGVVVAAVTNFLGYLDLGDIMSVANALALPLALIVMLAGLIMLTPFGKKFFYARCCLIVLILCRAFIVYLVIVFNNNPGFVMDVLASVAAIASYLLYIAVVAFTAFACFEVSSTSVADKDEKNKSCKKVFNIFIVLNIISLLVIITATVFTHSSVVLWIVLVFIVGLAAVAVAVLLAWKLYNTYQACFPLEGKNTENYLS